MIRASQAKKSSADERSRDQITAVPKEDEARIRKMYYELDTTMSPRHVDVLEVWISEQRLRADRIAAERIERATWGLVIATLGLMVATLVLVVVTIVH